MNARKNQSEGPEWLTLGEASRRLKVHPTTLRRWADEGQVPVMLTPGGHRRFAASDVRHIAERRHTIRHFGPVEQVWANEALERARTAVGARPQQQWLQGLDDQSRVAYRELGQRLMELTLRFLGAPVEEPSLVDEARGVGRDYGQRSREAGLPLTEALRASMFFRDALLQTAIELPQNVRIPPESQARLLQRISTLLNTVQLGVAEMYDGTRK
jgi:excisionase family DNA binding protein